MLNIITPPSWIEPADPQMPEPLIEYHDDGKTIQRITYYNHEREYHRTGGPALITFYESGTKLVENWYWNDMSHREDGPMQIRWHENGMKQSETWRQNDQYHREDGPAHTRWREDGSMSCQEWYREDYLYRNDGPSQIYYDADGTERPSQWKGCDEDAMHTYISKMSQANA